MVTRRKERVGSLIRTTDTPAPTPMANAMVISTYNMIAGSKAKEAKEAENPV